jgi:hypothetical protein
MAEKIAFSCRIDNRKLQERFSAEVVISKKCPVEVDGHRRINLDHIYITPVSGRLPQQRIKGNLETGAIEQIKGTRAGEWRALTVVGHQTQKISR